MSPAARMTDMEGTGSNKEKRLTFFFFFFFFFDTAREGRAASGEGAQQATLGCFALSGAAGYAFIVVEGRVAVPLLDLSLLRNRVLVGSTVAILIGAGTINALMYLLSLYFQDPATLGFSPLEAGLATLPATVGLVLVAPLVQRLAAKFGGRQTHRRRVRPHHRRLRHRGVRRLRLEVRSVPPAARCDCGRYGHVQRPSVVGGEGPRSGAPGGRGVQGLQTGAATSARQWPPPWPPPSMARSSRNQTTDGASQADALASGLAAAAWLMAVFSFLGVLMALVMGRRYRTATGTVNDAAASAAAISHTLPTSATATRAFFFKKNTLAS